MGTAKLDATPLCFVTSRQTMMLGLHWPKNIGISLEN